MIDYSAFDAKLVALLSSKPVRFSTIQLAMDSDATALHTGRPGESFRVTDRRLQALRKTQQISTVAGGWVTTQKENR